MELNAAGRPARLLYRNELHSPPKRQKDFGVLALWRLKQLRLTKKAVAVEAGAMIMQAAGGTEASRGVPWRHGVTPLQLTKKAVAVLRGP